MRIVKLLLWIDRFFAKVETVLLCTSLAALLLLTLYGVAYRNFVAPIVLKMQSRVIGTIDEPVQTHAIQKGDTTNRDKSDGDIEGSYAGDLDDEQTGPPSTTSGYAGDLEDESPSEQPAGNTYAGDLDDGQDSPQTHPTSPPAAPATQSSNIDLPEDTPLLAFLKWLSFSWIDVVTRHLLLYIAFFGASLAVRQRGHIKIEVLSRLFKGSAGERLRIFLNLVSFVTCIFLMRAAWRFLLAESEGGGMLYGSIPSWVGILIVPVGFGLLAFHFGLETLIGILDFFGLGSREFENRREELGLKEEVAR